MLSKSIPFKLFLAMGLLFSNTGFSQDVSDYFHTASKQFIHGKTEECKQTIATALSIYPNDKKLIALRDKIKDEEKKKQQNQQNQDQQQNKKDEQQKEKEQQKNISQEDANRILEAMQNEEKELQKKLKMEKVRKEKGKTLKNW